MILFLASYRNDNSGVSKKINMQINAFSKISHVWYFIDDSGTLYLRKKHHGKIVEEFECQRLSESKIIRDISMWSTYLKHVKKYLLSGENIDFVYYRMTPSNPGLVRLLSLLKSEFNSRIVKEIPTYPYEKELKTHGFVGKIKYVVDKIFKKSEHKNVDFIATFSSDKSIDGVPTIIIDNSIEESQIHEKLSKFHNTVIFPNDIKRFGMVTAVEFWQGVDRILYSLANYVEFNDRNIHFDLVGSGTDFDDVVELASKLDIEDIVSFHGFKNGADLDAVYKRMDVGIGPMGLFRKDLKLVSSLKTKEYILNYLPFVYSGVERNIDKFDFAFKVENSDKLIDFREIIDFFEKDLKGRKEINEFKSILKNHFTWEHQVKVILECVGINYESI